jgi:large-conductance mechanosensitive channel
MREELTIVSMDIVMHINNCKSHEILKWGEFIDDVLNFILKRKNE